MNYIIILSFFSHDKRSWTYRNSVSKSYVGLIIVILLGGILGDEEMYVFLFNEFQSKWFYFRIKLV